MQYLSSIFSHAWYELVPSCPRGLWESSCLAGNEFVPSMTKNMASGSVQCLLFTGIVRKFLDDNFLPGELGEVDVLAVDKAAG